MFCVHSILVVAQAMDMTKLEGVKLWTIYLQKFLVLNLQLCGHRFALASINLLFFHGWLKNEIHPLFFFIPYDQFFSGTHAITCALFAFLRPGDEVSYSSLFLMCHHVSSREILNSAL